MTYCTECGSEVEPGTQFCGECGTEIDAPAEAEPESIEETDDEGLDMRLAVVSGLMALLVGSVVAFAFTNFGGGSILFLVTLVGVTAYLYRREYSARGAVGTGLYILALWILAAPILFYIPVIGGAETGTAGGAGTVIGGALGIVIWGFAGLLIAIVVAGIGYLINRKAPSPA